MPLYASSNISFSSTFYDSSRHCHGSILQEQLCCWQLEPSLSSVLAIKIYLLFINQVCFLVSTWPQHLRAPLAFTKLLAVPFLAAFKIKALILFCLIMQDSFRIFIIFFYSCMRRLDQALQIEVF